MYSNDMSWTDWSYLITQKGDDLWVILDRGLEAYYKWYDYSYGKTNAEIATALGKTEADIAKIQAAFGVLKKMYDLLHGLDTQATAYDHSGSLRPF